MMYKSQFRKMDPYGFVVQGHILCLIYLNIISAFVTVTMRMEGSKRKRIVNTVFNEGAKNKAVCRA